MLRHSPGQGRAGLHGPERPLHPGVSRGARPHRRTYAPGTRPQTGYSHRHHELPNDGAGAPAGYTGMVWSGFRPSDDACTFPYLVPANMFAAVVLEHAAGIYRDVYGDEEMARTALRISREVRGGIERHGSVRHPEHGWVWAYGSGRLGRGEHHGRRQYSQPAVCALPGLCGHGRSDLSEHPALRAEPRTIPIFARAASARASAALIRTSTVCRAASGRWPGDAGPDGDGSGRGAGHGPDAGRHDGGHRPDA